MSALIKIFKKLILNFKSISKTIPKFSLCYPKIKIDHNQKPFFSTRLIINTHGDADDKLYVDDLTSNHQFYKTSFSDTDWNIIQYNLGALDALQMAIIYKLIELDYENMQVKMLNKSNGEKQKADIAEVILTKQYMNFDKQSIFELSTFFQTCKSCGIVQEQIRKLTKTPLENSLRENDNDNKNYNLSLPPFLTVIK